MLRITVHEDSPKWTMSLAGKLAESWVAETERIWRKAPRTGKHLQIDLTEVTWVDPAGRRLLGRMYGAGARLLAKGVATSALIEEIVNKRPSRTKTFSRGIPAVLSALLALSGTLRAQPAPAGPLKTGPSRRCEHRAATESTGGHREPESGPKPGR
jgi:hypothetical protein